MRRVVLAVAILALAMSTAAFADTITITNEGGTISVSDAGLFSKGSRLMNYNGTSSGRTMGTVSFGTGAFSGHSLYSGGTFSSAGSYFDIYGAGGKYGAPKGVIFTGAFVGPITWTQIAPSGHQLGFELTGQLAGMLFNGHDATGSTTQIFWASNHQMGLGIGHITMGTTKLSSTPEPSTLGLLGTGLVGIAALFRPKKKST